MATISSFASIVEAVHRHRCYKSLGRGCRLVSLRLWLKTRDWTFHPISRDKWYDNFKEDVEFFYPSAWWRDQNRPGGWKPLTHQETKQNCFGTNEWLSIIGKSLDNGKRGIVQQKCCRHLHFCSGWGDRQLHLLELCKSIYSHNLPHDFQRSHGNGSQKNDQVWPWDTFWCQ